MLFNKIFIRTRAHTHRHTHAHKKRPQKILYGLHMVDLLVSLFEICGAAKTQQWNTKSHSFMYAIHTRTHTWAGGRAKQIDLTKIVGTSLALKAYHKLKVECVTSVCACVRVCECDMRRACENC